MGSLGEETPGRSEIVPHWTAVLTPLAANSIDLSGVFELNQIPASVLGHVFQLLRCCPLGISATVILPQSSTEQEHASIQTNLC